MAMKIHAGYEISYDCLQPTPMILTLNVHPTRRTDLLTPDRMLVHPLVPTTEYCDGFGNICHVIHAPAGQLTLSADFLVQDSGEADEIAPEGTQCSLETLPVETLVYLLGSRYCETDRLSNIAWSAFGKIPKGWPLVQAICDFVHDHVRFGYAHANPLGDRWYTFDARHNTPRIGRILIARGRDATDVAIVTSFGPCNLVGFKVVTTEVTSAEAPRCPDATVVNS